MSRSWPGWRDALLLGALSLSLLSACRGGAREPAAPADAVASGYPASESRALYLGASNRQGGCTGGFGAAFGVADYAYRLGTATSPVPGTEIEALLAANAAQIGLEGDRAAALRRVLGERPAFAAWKQFFADGGRVRTYRPLGPEELARRPPSELMLAGQARYVPDRLLIVARLDEPSMEGLLFHEIQHYVLDKWDSPPFEAGDADHEVIRLLEERRQLVESLREGRLPPPESLPVRALRGAGGGEAATAPGGSPGGGDAGSEAFYRAWVDATLQRVRSKNESNRRVRMVTIALSNGKSLLFDERGDRDAPDDIRALDARIPPDYRFGPVVYVSLADLRRFDVERLFSGDYVPDADRSRVEEFVDAHRRDPELGRRHVFNEAELQDLAHLSAFNAAIFQQALALAQRLGRSAGHGTLETLATPGFQAAFSDSLRRYVDRMAGSPGGDPRSVARSVASEAPEATP